MRARWKLAMTEEVIRSWNNEIIAARVRVVNSYEGRSSRRRPLQHLLPLEIHPACKEKESVYGEK